MYATAVAGNGVKGGRASHRGRAGRRGRASRLAALHLLNWLQPEDLKFGVHTYVGKGRYYNITATGSTAYTPNGVSSRSPPAAPQRPHPPARTFYLFCPGDACPLHSLHSMARGGVCVETSHAFKPREVRQPASCLRRPQRLNHAVEPHKRGLSPQPSVQVVEVSTAPPGGRLCIDYSRG